MNRLLRRRRRTVPRRHAAEALEHGCCLFAARGDCADGVCPIGLRNPDDIYAVLVCARHVADLRRLRPYEADRLARYLSVRFIRDHESAAEHRDNFDNADATHSRFFHATHA
jgi:hypothetical protein